MASVKSKYNVHEAALAQTGIWVTACISCAHVHQSSVLLLCPSTGTVQEYRDEAMRHRLMLHFMNGTDEEAGAL